MTTRGSMILVLGLFAAFACEAADEGTGQVLISVDATLLNNRGDPTGYAKHINEFKVMNIETRRRYSSVPSSDRHPSLMRLPAGTYCLYSVQTYTNEELTYCKQPYFEAKGGRISNLGRWRIGVSYDAGTYKLMHFFHQQEEVERQARERYPELFKQSEENSPAADSASATAKD